MKDLLVAIKNRDEKKVLELIKDYDPKIENGEIFLQNKELLEKEHEYYDRLQYIKKILLNSLYGAILNEGCRLYDERIGQSVTLSGRKITHHMLSYINEILEGKYDHHGSAIIYGDTDSVTGSSKIYYKIENRIYSSTIEEFFNLCEKLGNKSIEYRNKTYLFFDEEIITGEEENKQNFFNQKIEILSFDENLKQPVFKELDYAYKSNNNNEIYELELETGEKIEITEDHSICVLRNDKLLYVKPNQILPTDKFIRLVEKHEKT